MVDGNYVFFHLSLYRLDTGILTTNLLSALQNLHGAYIKCIKVLHVRPVGNKFDKLWNRVINEKKMEHEAVVVQWHKRVTVNATAVGSIYLGGINVCIPYAAG